jgi:phosphoribosylformimino-5-aminoimidazole carboxamide ribotide isomerase
MNSFTIFPAIDLRQGRVVRLQEGDPKRQTVYADDPASVARKWLEHGAMWLHVVNLDGAFGSEDIANRQAIKTIIEEAAQSGAKVQFGGGLRTYDAIEAAINLGAERIVVGTVAAEEPQLLRTVLDMFGSEHIAVSLDGRKDKLMVRGWLEATNINILDLAIELKAAGLCWVVYTDISRDGMQRGVNLRKTKELTIATHLKIIASGGINSIKDLENLEKIGTAGAIVGKALYEGAIDPDTIFSRWAERSGKTKC